MDSPFGCPSINVSGVGHLAADGNEPVQMKLHKSLRIWTFYVDLEESLGTLESTRAVYERILDLRIATPQIIINYSLLLEEHKYFEDAFKVYERGVKIFKYPHVKDIWVTYLSKFVKRYGKSKLERARELFEHAVEMWKGWPFGGKLFIGSMGKKRVGGIDVKWEKGLGRVRFWKDRWYGDDPLCTSFPSLFAISSSKEAWVEDIWNHSGGEFRIPISLCDTTIGRVFSTCFKVGSGNKVKFWKDGWCEDLPLRDVFPNLFSITFSKDARMVDVWDNGSWNPRRADPFLHGIVWNSWAPIRAPAESVKPLYMQYAKLEEDFGLAKRAMKVYDQAAKAVPNNEKLSMYEIYIARASEIFGIPKTREIYEQAITSGVPDKDVKTMCMKYAELEKSLGEIDRARGIFVYASQLADPRSDADFWNKWHEFEVQHVEFPGSPGAGQHPKVWVLMESLTGLPMEDSLRRAKTHFLLPEYLMQKDPKLNLDEAMDTLKQAGVPEDEMAALERQLVPTANNTAAKESSRKVGFVSAGVESQPDEGIKVTANHEDIELPEESDSEDEKVEIAQKDIPNAVFGGLVRKREEADGDGDGDEDEDGAASKDKDRDSQLGALERIKRQRQA
ncbi:Pre-mRNA-splicing factor SYF1 [Vitis vinifera]|uniref:Pre-mRNA-splicing factor SYF1 n=1 Tax=Vitis vinifera TaxID=29760 RepID=A0A438EF36_VITVI|nr:Pre-mRNA-splicing factor SYF1 [Vitis vinifera]